MSPKNEPRTSLMSVGFPSYAANPRQRNVLCCLALLFLFAYPARSSDVTPLPKLDCAPELLDKIQDDQPLFSASEGEQAAFARFVLHARGIAPDALLPVAKPNLTVQQLLEASMRRYRGQVLHVEGRLEMLREVPAGPELEKAGVRVLYEGRIVEPSVHPVPTTVIFVELPKGLKPGEAVSSAVALDGYFFKRHKYDDAEKVSRMAAVVIGRTVSLREPLPDTPTTPMPEVPQSSPAPEGPNPKMDCPREWLEHIEDDQKVMSQPENADEYQAYNYFVLHARKFSPDLMAKHTNRQLTFRRLFDDGRAEYRGSIVRVKGRLKQLRWIGTNEDLKRDGVKDLYEAWIFDEAYFSNPTCVIISEPPPGIKASDENINGVWVECDAYFFKRYRYRAESSTRLAPLAIGRTLTVTKAPTSGDREIIASAYSRWFIPILAGLGLIVVGAFFLMHRYFKRGDRWVRNRIEQTQTANPFGDNGALTMDSPATNRLPDEPSLN